MEVRLLTEDDVEAYWAVRLRALREDPQAFGAAYDEQKDRPLAAVAARLHAMTESDDFVLGAFEEAGEEWRLVGIVAFTRETNRRSQHIGAVYQMYIAPEARGKGYSRALMRTLIDRARTLGVERLHLDVVMGNDSARSLYTSLGFVTYGRQPEALKYDDGTYRDEEQMSLRLDETPPARPSSENDE